MIAYLFGSINGASDMGAVVTFFLIVSGVNLIMALGHVVVDLLRRCLK